jgi:hypothetical protein
MKKIKDSIQYSASDLINHLGCKHLTELDRQTVLGIINPPDWINPALALIQQKGIEHELVYVTHMFHGKCCAFAHNTLCVASMSYGIILSFYYFVRQVKMYIHNIRGIFNSSLVTRFGIIKSHS